MKHSPLLALFGRSVREDVRLKMTYFTRVGLILLILLFLLTVRESNGWGNAPGLRFFSTVVFINFFFVILAGFSYFASAITEEKEEMTLGLLRMTNLNPLSILLGKSTSRLLGALLLLAAQFPFTLLAISLGGVAVRQILAAYCTLGAFIIFLSNLALLASVVCRRTVTAAGLTGFILFAFFALVPFLHWLAMLPLSMGLVTAPGPAVKILGQVADVAAIASPFSRLQAILGTGFSDAPAGAQVWSNLGLGAGCFLLAWAVFEVFCSEQQESAPSRNLVVRRTSRLRSLGAGRTWQRALAWKDFYFLVGGKVWIFIKLLVYAVPPVAFALIPQAWGSRPSMVNLGYFTLWIAGFIGALELSFTAASIFRQERRWKTLSSLATLPMSMAQIAWQKVLGCLPALIPATAYFLAGLACAWSDAFPSRERYSNSWNYTAILGLCYTAAQFTFFLHLIALLSLYLKRGALPLAIAIHFVGYLLMAITFTAVFGNAGDEDAVFSVLIALAIMGVIALQVFIGRRLEKLAEED